MIKSMKATEILRIASGVGMVTATGINFVVLGVKFSAPSLTLLPAPKGDATHELIKVTVPSGVRVTSSLH
jgi:hypothetical protein